MGDDVFIRKMQDVFRLSEKYHTPRFSKFLDGAQQEILKRGGIFGGVFFGGYEGAERCVLGAFPPWQEPENELFPIKALFVKKKYERELSHRDYLGTLLSLGIERNKTGDILVTDSGAYIFVLEDIAEFICGNISKVSGCGVEVSIVSTDGLVVPEKKFCEICVVAGSLRLDAVVAAMLNISRNDAKALILAGKVSVNHTEALSCDFMIKENDLLSVRGFGRAVLSEIGGKTRSDRVHITLKKYI